jgi:phospholysine phosphohistidine inorganic pyrophosphate phosphatase
MRGILFDLDGVFYVGDTPVPGGPETLAWVRANAIPHLFLTNTTSRPRAAIAEKLHGFGIEAQIGEILTPPVAAVRWIREHVEGGAALFVPQATRAEFDELETVPVDGLTPAAAVVVGDLGEGWDFPTLNRVFRLLMQSPPPALIALGMTRYWRAADGLRLDVGAYVSALEFASGARPVVLGKPAAAFYETALALLGCRAEDTVMIGDDIRGDIGGALTAGIDAVLVRTGKFRAADLEGEIRPTVVLDSVAALPAWWVSRR